mgnify:CR=1 FL=1
MPPNALMRAQGNPTRACAFCSSTCAIALCGNARQWLCNCVCQRGVSAIMHCDLLDNSAPSLALVQWIFPVPTRGVIKPRAITANGIRRYVPGGQHRALWPISLTEQPRKWAHATRRCDMSGNSRWPGRQASCLRCLRCHKKAVVRLYGRHQLIHKALRLRHIYTCGHVLTGPRSTSAAHQQGPGA